MPWTWQLPDWPRYQWDRTALRPLENRFLHASGRRVGALLHAPEDEQVELRIEWLTAEAVETSAIEGEILNRDSVRSSLRRHLGLTADRRTVSPAEAGVAEMMVALYKGFDHPLSHETIRDWHRVLMRHRSDLTMIGDYRRHPEPMQVVSGPVGRRRVHYEAPPSHRVPAEMDAFVNWYRESGRSDAALSPLTRAGLAHLYFVHIHPFEDGNGRIARAIAQKTLAESFGEPSVIALSRTIARSRRAYYDRLAFAGRSLDATDWGVWFGETTLDAQLWSERRVIRSIEAATDVRPAPGSIEPASGKGPSPTLPCGAGRLPGRPERRQLPARHRGGGFVSHPRPGRSGGEGRFAPHRIASPHPLLA